MSKRGRPPLAEKSTQVAVRLPAELIAALDRYVGQLRQDTPGLSVTRADVVRILLARGLEAAGFAPEGDEAPPRIGNKRTDSTRQPTRRSSKAKTERTLVAKGRIGN